MIVETALFLAGIGGATLLGTLYIRNITGNVKVQNILYMALLSQAYLAVYLRKRWSSGRGHNLSCSWPRRSSFLLQREHTTIY